MRPLPLRPPTIPSARMSIRLLDAPEVPIPPHWSTHIKHAYLAAFSLAHHVLFAVRSLVHYDTPFAARQELTRERLEAALAARDEQIRILKSRFLKIPSGKRPFYSSTDRFAILKLKQATGWSFERTAREFLVSGETIRKWVRTLESDSLVAPPAPVNKFPDFVAALVHQLKSVFPLLGAQAIADYLARGGLHLSESSVRRFLMRPRRSPPQSPASSGATKPFAQRPSRIVATSSPNQIWHIDITTIPTSAGLALFGFPHAFPKLFPFSYDVVAVLDHFSRRVLAMQVFLKEPKTRDVVSVLERAAASAGTPPKHIISDKGPQFWNLSQRKPSNAYQVWLAAHGVRPRFGAVGKKGSIAVIERFFGSLKRSGTRRILIPYSPHQMQTELNIFAQWYNSIRPHQSLGGRTPDDVWHGRIAEHTRLEPRALYPIAQPELSKRVSGIELQARPFRGRSHLPSVSLRAAA